jgi:hypothetical protein
MDTKTRSTKQGLRDLNFYGSRKKLAEASAAAAVTASESGVPAIVEAGVEPATEVATALADTTGE